MVEPGIHAVLWVFAKVRRPEADRTPDGIWVLRYAGVAQGFFLCGVLMFVTFAVLALFVSGFDPGADVRARRLAAAAFVGFAALCGWVLAAFSVRVELDETGLTFRRPLRTPRHIAWHELARIATAPSEIVFVPAEGRKVSLSVIGLHGTARLRWFLDRKVPGLITGLPGPSRAEFERALPDH